MGPFLAPISNEVGGDHEHIVICALTRCPLSPFAPFSRGAYVGICGDRVDLVSCSRIKYILRQSDIFATHFGVTLSESEDEIEEAEKEQDMATGATARLANGGGTAALGSPSKRRHAERVADEVVEADANGDDKAPTYLVQQPPSITGGKLRPYQLEGLNWMINLHAQGTNGEGGTV